MIDYGSICSGIEAASVAWESQGFKPAWFSEIDVFASKVLRHHWPQVANLGSMLELPLLVKHGVVPAPRVLVGGTPCQSFSIAGKQLGLDDERGQLTLAYVDLMNAIDNVRGEGDECVCVWENVPGVLSDKGNAFGIFLAKLAGEDGPLVPAGKKWSNAGCVFGPQRAIAWRVLDAQYFGVAQRRRRVFLVASARSGFNPAKVLFESEGVRRDIAPGRTAKKDIAGTITAGISKGMRGTEGVESNWAVIASFGAYAEQGVPTLRARGGDLGGGSEALTYKWPADIASTLNANFGKKQGIENQHVNSGCPLFVPTADLSVRRITPIECERLQGFPDGHTNILPTTPDGPRYKALGNSMAVPCMAWIGARLKRELGL